MACHYCGEMMTADQVKPFKGKKCLVKYGQSGQLEGTVRTVTTERAHIQVGKADYGVPLDQITRITPLSVVE